MKRYGAVLLIATALSSCGFRPSDAELRRASVVDARMPDCAVLRPASFVRDEGGGWQGGGFTIRATLPLDCAAEWRAGLTAAGFECRGGCKGAASGREIAVLFDKGVASMYFWALT